MCSASGASSVLTTATLTVGMRYGDTTTRCTSKNGLSAFAASSEAAALPRLGGAVASTTSMRASAMSSVSSSAAVSTTLSPAAANIDLGCLTRPRAALVPTSALGGATSGGRREATVRSGGRPGESHSVRAESVPKHACGSAAADGPGVLPPRRSSAPAASASASTRPASRPSIAAASARASDDLPAPALPKSSTSPRASRARCASSASPAPVCALTPCSPISSFGWRSAKRDRK